MTGNASARQSMATTSPCAMGRGRCAAWRRARFGNASIERSQHDDPARRRVAAMAGSRCEDGPIMSLLGGLCPSSQPRRPEAFVLLPPDRLLPFSYDADGRPPLLG